MTFFREQSLTHCDLFKNPDSEIQLKYTQNSRLQWSSQQFDTFFDHRTPKKNLRTAAKSADSSLNRPNFAHQLSGKTTDGGLDFPTSTKLQDNDKQDDANINPSVGDPCDKYVGKFRLKTLECFLRHFSSNCFLGETARNRHSR